MLYSDRAVPKGMAMLDGQALYPITTFLPRAVSCLFRSQALALYAEPVSITLAPAVLVVPKVKHRVVEEHSLDEPRA
jgi:hypothetical protein